jgi:hypothetical protein
MDQMLERLSKKTHFYFLDGYSGFSQICYILEVQYGVLFSRHHVNAHMLKNYKPMILILTYEIKGEKLLRITKHVYKKTYDTSRRTHKKIEDSAIVLSRTPPFLYLSTYHKPRLYMCHGQKDDSCVS